ncbi:MAG: hypothetical protein HGA45_25320, partial [Chloroflexales bacterium]|nr:hypothetical protein [Chloroflexales bacterium]
MHSTHTGPITRPLALLPILALVLMAYAAFFPGTTRAAGVVGNGTAASCTEADLRSAVTAGGAVSFNCGADPVTITLGSTLEVRSKTVEIDGGNKVTLSGGGRIRVIYVDNGTLTLRNLTIRDGRSDRGGGLHLSYYSKGTVINCRFLNNTGAAGVDEEGGGGIAARVSTLTVRDSYFEGNTGINGGAIHSLVGGLTVERSTFINNDTLAGGPLGGGFGAGGAIYTDGASHTGDDSPGGQVIIRDSYFRGNRGAAQGGAVMTFVYEPDSVLIEGSVFEENSVQPDASGTGAGGGLRHGGGPITLRNSLFVGNTAVSGGAFWSGRDFPGLIENVTFVDNTASSADGRSGQGGALFIADGEFTIRNSTIADNYADFYGGGIVAVDERVSLFNSIISGNWAGDGTRIWNQCSRNLPGGANNIQSPSRAERDGGDYRCAPNINFADPKLGPLGDYGGPFSTISLLAGSPAIDAGANCPATDARGATRVGPCDSGAFEFDGVIDGSDPTATPVPP